MLSHIQPQAHCLRAEGNAGWAVDFIGRTEHLDEDLAAVLAELEQRRPDGAPQVGASPLARWGPELGSAEGG